MSQAPHGSHNGQRKRAPFAVPCCDDCNKRKGSQDFNLWLERVNSASLEEELQAWSQTVQERIEILRAYWAKEEKPTTRRVNKWTRLIA